MADPADEGGATASLEQIAVAFGRRLRQAGLDVGTTSVAMFTEALSAVGLGMPSGVYWAGRACLLHRPEDAESFDRVFNSFWLGRSFPLAEGVTEQSLTLALDDPDAPPGEAGDSRLDSEVQLAVRYSAAEVLRHKDFAGYSAAEFAEARRLMADVRLAGALRRSRRRRPSRAARGTPDLRRTVRHAVRSSGEVVRRSFLQPTRRPRRVVLLCDVSGSMEPYARALIRFLHAAVVGRGPGSSRVEAFALGTRLTRLTRELSWRDPDAALAAAAAAVLDWSGGTRLGEGLRVFNDRWGVSGLARGAVVVILSDGWDRGDTSVLAEQMARLHRVAYRVVWVNPLKASPGYAPLAKGMSAALPYVDEFLEGHSLAALESLAEVIAR